MFGPELLGWAIKEALFHVWRERAIFIIGFLTAYFIWR